MKYFEIRTKLLEEAKASPNLLSDLAGLEKYIGESYNNRSFIELLQNADDSKSTKFKIVRQNNNLFVLNNGREFNEQDLESLCRSASSNKIRGDSIGFRGIGFKSVVGFAKEIHLISGDLEITFSKERTSLEIPTATHVPLIRIPHDLVHEDKLEFKSIIDESKASGYTTIFIFSGITGHEIEIEFASFETLSLLFLRNICEAEFGTGSTSKTIIQRIKESNEITRVNLLCDNSISSWLINNSEESSIAFNVVGQKIRKLEYINSQVYSFLPTEDHSGLGVILNGDFSTDPSRKHVIYDEKTLSTISSCAKHILNILEFNLENNLVDSLAVVNSLVPYIDPRMLQFKKPNFERYLLEELRNCNSHTFGNMTISPNWLNNKDYSRLNKSNSAKQIDIKYFNLDGFIMLSKYLGAKEDSFNYFKSNINSVYLSILGCVQISVHIFNGIISKTIDIDDSITQLKVIMSNSARISLEELRENNLIIDQSFLSLLIENGLTEFDIKQVLSKYISINYSELLFEKNSNDNDNILKIGTDENESRWFPGVPTSNFQPTKSNVFRWRSAEENAMEVLNLNGFKLIDVSKQNVGFDYEGFDPDGNEIQIEVKSITMIGQAFKLTNNEIAVAQDKGDSYYIAIVRQLENFIEIALIPDPIKNLVFNRQCIQWIWECSNYDYKPTKFEI